MSNLPNASSDGGGLHAEVAALRAELATLRAELATEVRTRRLVVVDEHGHERVVVGEPYRGQFGMAILDTPEETAYGPLSINQASFVLGRSPHMGEATDCSLQIDINEHSAFELRAVQYDDGTIESYIELECRRARGEGEIPPPQYLPALAGPRVRLVATEDL